MNIKELIQKLKAIEDKNIEVLMSSDAKGNGFHSVESVLPTGTHAEGEHTRRYVIWPEHDDVEVY